MRMKSRYWLMVLGAVLVACVGLSAWLLWPSEAAQAQIISDGRIVAVVDLSVDGEWIVEAPAGGMNVVTVRDGAVAVTAADCPDKHCVKRGFCSGGPAIVCLPHALVIEFLGDQDVDGAVG